MVNIVFYLEENDYCGFSSIGHAEFDKIGSDIVCSAISSVIVGGLNAIDNTKDFDISIKSGNVKCLKKKDKNISLNDKVVLKTIRIQLETIKESRPKNISIREERIKSI